MSALKAVPANHIDLRTVIEMLENGLEEVRDLNGTPLEDAGGNSSVNRELNNRLLALSDGLQLASGLVRSEYWAGRGRAL